MPKGDQIPMFPEPLRHCLGCRTKHEPFPEIYMGGFCPTCGSAKWEPAVLSDYSMTEDHLK